MNLETELQITEISTARGPGSHADIIVTAAELAERLSQIRGRTVTVNHYIDVNEMTEKVRIALSQDT